MSGGALYYVYGKVEEAADKIGTSGLYYEAFTEHLRKVAKALHDIEWVLSGDYGPGEDIDSIKAVLSQGEIQNIVTRRIVVAIEDGRRFLSELEKIDERHDQRA